MARKKIRVGVIFGGQTGEHEVSLVSATSVIHALDKEKYEVVPIGIAKNGKWLSSPETMALLKSGADVHHEKEKILLPDPTRNNLLNIEDGRDAGQIDVVFPVLHGRFGEDGTIQGLLELANIPYVGGGVLASSVGLDKIIQKKIFADDGLPVAQYEWFTANAFAAEPRSVIDRIEKSIFYPNFVKPANTGSSVGITKARNRKELILGVDLAAKYDRKILVEQAVKDVREIECAVLGNDEPEASVCGEVIPSGDFYDYNAKYVNGESQIIIPAQIPDHVSEKVRKYALQAFRAIDCGGMARVDFFVVKHTDEIFLN